MSSLDGILTNLRYASGVVGFLRTPITPAQARETTLRQLAARSENFLRVIRQGVFANHRSPYLRLLRHAGIDFADIQRLVAESGLEGTLHRLYDAGVYVSQEEMKGRQPIRRDGLEFLPSQDDFDNPLIHAAQYTTKTSGSTGAPSRMRGHFESVAETAPLYLAARAVHWGGRPVGIWDEGEARRLVLLGKIGRPPEKYFTTASFNWDRDSAERWFRINWAVGVSRVIGRPLPMQEVVQKDDAVRVARWLAEKTALGTPAVLICHPSPVVRVCLAAKENGLDISGTLFSTGGEPYTPGKAAVVASVGGEARVHYGMVETGAIGEPCGNAAALDDVHLLAQHVALIPRERLVGPNEKVTSLVLTSLLPRHTKIVLNLESGDYATVEERDCGCPLEALGLRTHLSGIRSYEKLTGEGVTFIGSRLLQLVEEDLPARFGGRVNDYQLVEEEQDGITTLSIVVSPRIGPIDDAALTETVMQTLTASHASAGGAYMSEQWRQGNTLRVVRREPAETHSLKIMPLRVVRPPSPE